MAGFRKARGEQAALKMALYGPPGAGKTFSSLLIAEGLAKVTGKRIAFVDTEHGTDFYSQAVPSRKIHPAAFDFDALYTRAITEILPEVKQLDPDQYGVLVIDSITHVWEACKHAYEGRQTKPGAIPFYAWNAIKKPYKELISFLLNTPMHVLICGRQGNEFAENEETGEIQRVGFRMKAEGETPYEPHVLIRMEAVKTAKAKTSTITAFVEKDRTGVLSGKTIAHPSFENLAQPLLGLLGHSQARIPSDEEVGAQDAEALARQEAERSAKSKGLVERFTARLSLAESLEEVEAIAKEITPALKREMVASDLAVVRQCYLDAKAKRGGHGPARGRKAAESEDDYPGNHLYMQQTACGGMTNAQ